MRAEACRVIVGVLLPMAVAFVASDAGAQGSGRPVLPITPGDPASSALGESPGRSGAAQVGGSGEVQSVIPVGPGPSYPRVPRGITRPPEPFGPQAGLGIEPLSPIPEAERLPAGRFGALKIEETEGPPGGLTIDQSIDRLVRLNLELRAQALEIPKARADVLTAGLRGNPLIYTDASLVPYGNFNRSGGGPTQYDLNITLPIDLNGKRRRRLEVAERAREVTEAQYQDAVRLQLDNLYTAWIDVLAARATIRFLEMGLEGLAAQKRVTEEMARKGTASRNEVNNIEIQIDSADLTLLEARETYDDAMRTLAALLMIPPEQAETFPIRGTLRVPDLPPPPIDRLIDRALAYRPDLAAFRLGVRRAQSEVRLARANRLNDVFLLYQPLTVQEGLLRDERAAYSWAMGVTVPVPVFDRNQGNIARAQHTVVQTQAQVANLERQVMLEVQRAEAAYSVTRATIRRMQEETLPAALENLKSSQAQAGQGESTTLARLEARRAFGEVSRQYLDALVRHRRSMLRLNTAVGARVFP